MHSVHMSQHHVQPRRSPRNGMKPSGTSCMPTKTHHTQRTSSPPSISSSDSTLHHLKPCTYRPKTCRFLHLQTLPPSPSSGVFMPKLYSEPSLPLKKMLSAVNRATSHTFLDCLLSKSVILVLCQPSTCHVMCHPVPRTIPLKVPRPYVCVVDFRAKFLNTRPLLTLICGDLLFSHPQHHCAMQNMIFLRSEIPTDP